MCEALGSNPNTAKKKVCQLFFVKLKSIVCACMCVYTHVCVHAHGHVCAHMWKFFPPTMWAWVAVMVVSAWWSILLACVIFFEEVVYNSSLLSGLRLIDRIDRILVYVENVVCLNEEKGRKGILVDRQ